MKAPHFLGKAFTLIELLVVVAIMGLLLSFVVPMAGSMRQAGELNKAITQISLSLEQARAYAMGNSTYVWVGFTEDQSARTLTMSLVAGNSGAASDLTAGRWRAITNPVRFDQVQLHDGAGVPRTSSADDLRESLMPTYELSVRGAAVSFQDVIRFGPSGDVQIKPDEMSRWIQLGLKQAHQSDDHPNVAVLQVAGLSGQVRIFRP